MDVWRCHATGVAMALPFASPPCFVSLAPAREQGKSGSVMALWDPIETKTPRISNASDSGASQHSMSRLVASNVSCYTTARQDRHADWSDIGDTPSSLLWVDTLFSESKQ